MVILPMTLSNPQNYPNFSICTAFHIFVMGARNLVCMWTVASPSLLTTRHPWKGHGQGHVTHFRILHPLSVERLQLETSNFVHLLAAWSCHAWLSTKWSWSRSRDPLLGFWFQAISLERIKLDISNLVRRLNVRSTAITRVKVLQYVGAFRITWPLKILENKC